MVSALDQLLEEGIISEVVGRLQSGKEAEVFIVRYAERLVAAKVYKDRSQRNFKNNAAYKEGRGVRNTRDQRAMDRRSRYGKTSEEDAWKSAEADALYRLHAAQVRVPTPVLFFEGVLLMDLVLDAEGVTARRLIDSSLTAEQAHLAYHDMLVQLVRMLACDLIHGDLSPYNVLWAAAGATIIDFPQIVSAAQNSNSERFFLRDAENILGYFRSLDPRLQARRSDASEIWRAYMRRELTADFIPSGKMRPPPPPQRPLPIGAPRPQQQQQRGYASPSHQQRGYASPSQQAGGAQQRRDGQSPHQRRGNGSPQQQRGNGSPQQQRGNGSPQQQRGNGSPQQQRGNGPPPRGQRGSRPSPEQRGPAGRSNASGRRPMPEVIVRPRAVGPASAAPRPTATVEPGVPIDTARNSSTKRR